MMVYTIVMTVEVNAKSQQYLGRRLKDARERRNLSQQEVANTVGISVTYYAGIERGIKN
jgi:DNA-binding XRE family transcriptional regulator